MRSMTGFGQAAKETERFRVTVTVRGVNHRFLDLSLRLREEHRTLEPALRELVTSRQERGRVELSVDVEAVGTQAFEVEIDESLVSSLHALGQKLAARGLISGQLELGDLLKVPELVQLRARDPEWTGEDRALWLEVVATALDDLVAARETEGRALFEVLAERREELAEIVARLSERRAALPEEMARSLKQRISELLGEALDEDRVAQEVVLLVERSDVSEELDRLRSHLEHFRSIMHQSGSVGKRLDFLSQEILRELNTVGSKCRDSEMIRWVLDAKVLCEQIREQVQNVE
ncbi:MAG: YicC family protein [bacterium]|nr:YicC family protein [bacterium]